MSSMDHPELVDSLLKSHSREALLAGIQRQKEKRRRRAEEEAEAIEFSKGGKIHIKKANRGKFTESARRAGMGVQEYARHVLANRDRYSSTLVRRANFARNAASWHPDGGLLDKAGDVAVDLANAGLLGTPGIAAFWAGKALSHGRDKDNGKETVGQRIERRIREDNEAYRNRMNDVFTGIETTGGRAYSPDFITYADSYLQRAGLNRNQRSAVIANIIEESGGDPYAKSPDGKFYGLLQWAGDRYPSSNDRPRDWGRTIDSQLDYLVGSLGNLNVGKSWTHGGTGTGYNSRTDAYADWMSDDPDRVMRGYTLGYVRPTGKLGSLANRAKVQRQLLDNNKFASGGPQNTNSDNENQQIEKFRRIRPNTSSTKEESAEMEYLMNEAIIDDNAKHPADDYYVPYLIDQEIKVDGNRVSKNILDSLAVNARRAHIPILDGIALSRYETVFGATPHSTFEEHTEGESEARKKYVDEQNRELANTSYARSYGGIPAASLINDYEWYNRSYDDTSIDRKYGLSDIKSPLQHGFTLYKAGLYNTGDKGHKDSVNKTIGRLEKDEEFNKWLSSFYERYGR